MENSPSQSYKVVIYNQTYSLRSEHDPEYIHELAEYVDKHGLAEISQIFSEGVKIEVGDMLPSSHYAELIKRVSAGRTIFSATWRCSRGTARRCTRSSTGWSSGCSATGCSSRCSPRRT